MFHYSENCAVKKEKKFLAFQQTLALKDTQNIYVLYFSLPIGFCVIHLKIKNSSKVSLFPSI